MRNVFLHCSGSHLVFDGVILHDVKINTADSRRSQEIKKCSISPKRNISMIDASIYFIRKFMYRLKLRDS